jgi:outer membrane protein TolC
MAFRRIIIKKKRMRRRNKNMNRAALLLSSFVASHTCTAVTLLSKSTTVFKAILLLLLAVVTKELHGQDAAKTLSLQQVMEIVKRFHPIAKQADIYIEKAKTEVTIAKGGFDPLLYNSNAQKTFDGTRYYNYNRPEITIPTWYGVEVSAGLEYLSGNRTSPEETQGSTSYIGISVPLAKNLLMDKRRAALQTAKIFQQASLVERRNMLNDLMLEAAKAYWYWAQYYQEYLVLNDAVKMNEKRLELVKTSFRLGDRPAIDTTEALTQLQSFEVMRDAAQLNFQNAGLELAVHLWTEQAQPATLPVDALPFDIPLLQAASKSALPVLDEMLDAARKNHPELLLYNFKLDALTIEKKLKFQGLLPTANFRYNQLGKGYNILKTATAGPLFENNFQYGITLGIPLRLSEGRGEYQQAKLKITETKLDQNLKMVQIENKVRSYFNELTILKSQINTQEQAWQNFLRLQRGEEIRFQTGESSLFLINARENKALEALQKLQQLRAKYLIATNSLQWAAGNLFN